MKLKTEANNYAFRKTMETETETETPRREFS